MQPLDLTTSAHAFFKGEIDLARKALNLRYSEDIEFYLVNLLVEFINPVRIDRSLSDIEGEKSALGKPLAFILKQAVESPPEKRSEILRSLGDVSLYVSGFFQEYFNGKTFDISYYIQLGSSAYDEVATCDRFKGPIFLKLAKDFSSYVDLFAQISERFRPTPVNDLLHTYERWGLTGSKRLLAKMTERGIVPLPTKLKIAQ